MDMGRQLCRRQTAKGLTLVEALICVAILGVLVSLAAPSFRAALSKHRIAAVRTELVTSIQWARWEALRRNTTVTLLRRTDCATPLTQDDDWHCGWDVVAGPHVTKSSRVADADVLQGFGVSKDVRLVHVGGGQALQFARTGYPLLVANKFIVGPPGGLDSGVAASQYTATLCMNRTGRVRPVEGQMTC